MVWPFEDDLPRSSADIERLEGDPYSLRVAAGDLRGLAGHLETARTAAGELESISDGSSWQGAGFDAFRLKVEKNPKATDIANAQSRMNEAAGVIERLASGIADCQSRIDWCRQRIDSLGIPRDGDVPEELRPQIEAIRDDAESARGDYERHLRDAGDRFAEMTDQTVYAEPPPGLLDRAAGVLGFVGEIAIGIVEGVWEMVKGVVSIVALVVQPWKWDDAWRTLTQIVQFAIENPGEFFTSVGKAIVDWDTLTTNPGRWLGKLVPNLVLAVLTGGAGTAAIAASRIAAMSARFGRISRVANRVARVSTRIDNVGRASNLARWAHLRGRPTRAQIRRRNAIAGRKGEELSQQKWQKLGTRQVASEVTLRSHTSKRANGTPRRARIDHIFKQPGQGGLVGVESKNGLGADLRGDQRIIYDELANGGVEVRTDKLADAGFPRGSSLQADVHVDHWYSPPDVPSVGKQAAVQAGAEAAKIAGDDDRFDVPPNR